MSETTTPTPDREALLALAHRCEKADGPDRELDICIKAAIHGGFAMISPFNGEWCVYREEVEDPRKGRILDRPRSVTHAKWAADAFTASLDAAMTLVPEQAKWMFDSHYNMAAVCVYWEGHEGPEMTEYPGEGHTPALALTAACLKARALAGDRP